MSAPSRPIRLIMVAITVAGMSTVAAALDSPVSAATSNFRALPRSVPVTTDKVSGSYRSTRMTIEVALAPRDPAGLAAALSSVYDRKSPDYRKWLSKGQFVARYAPSRAERAAVARYLRSAGLRTHASSSPFLVRATGSSATVSAAFRTTLHTYTGKGGVRYFANSTSVQLPATLASSVSGVIGLTNTIRSQSSARRAPATRPAAGRKAGSSRTGCEQPYPTAQQLFDATDNGTPFPFGYGGGPGCQGLTPSQTNSLYGAPNVGARGKGKGVTLGLFELSAYQQSDIQTWARTFYGNGYTAPLTDVTVDGGPLNPICPAGDQCPPQYNGYSGDIEVDADIEAQLAISPDAKNLIVYNAPNDYTGQTTLDELTAIANADKAAVVSSSWAVCENDVTAGYVQAENTVFQQMALQGQSMFGAEGDTGAFSCIRSDGSTNLNVLDPPSQPWVTSVGGTSFENFNPGTNPNPTYPEGVETVWNTDSLCSADPPAASNDNKGGFFWCANSGAGGGGASQWWGRPVYQVGQGVNSPYTTYANGTTQCALARTGTPCREDPDISANADEYTPYAEYCTGSATTPYSVCGTFSQQQSPPGWFGIGGTSLASPVLSGIIADRDSYFGIRSGNINPLLYLLLNIAPSSSFHDITGAHQTTTDNGFFPVTRGYDEATGVGTPRMAALITRLF